MRETKFRYVYQHEETGNIVTQIFTLDEIEGGLAKFCALKNPRYNRIGRDEHTGLKDKNGKEIYKGDIISFAVFDYNDIDTHYTGVVKWCGSRFMIWHNNDSEYYGTDGGFDLDWVLAQYDETEVIGNIHDNPELLEGGKANV